VVCDLLEGGERRSLACGHRGFIACICPGCTVGRRHGSLHAAAAAD